MRGMHCRVCFFYAPDMSGGTPQKKGVCRFEPPTPLSVAQWDHNDERYYYDIEYVRPEVRESDFCGRFDRMPNDGYDDQITKPGRLCE